MSKLLDKICTVRDLTATKEYDKLKFHKMTFLTLKEEIHRHIKKKSQDYSYNLDFTSQDLREMAGDIRSMMKRWETTMNPEKNIKKLANDAKENVIDINPFISKTLPVMIVRTECMQPLIELLNIAEYYGTFLYYLEMASDDKFALKYTERII